MKSKTIAGIAIIVSMALVIFALVIGARAARATALINRAYAQIQRPETISEDQLREIHDSLRWCAPLDSRTNERVHKIEETVKYVRFLREHGFKKGEITYCDGDGVFRIDNVSIESYYGPYYASVPFS